MRNAGATVELEILRTPAGMPFFTSQLRAHGGATTIRAVLDRMQTLGLVRCLANGLYVRPLRDESGRPCDPGVEAILAAIKCADACSLWPCSDIEVAAGELVFWSTGRSRTLRLSDVTLKCRHSPLPGAPGAAEQGLSA
jgi:hypothetical protein